MLSLHSHGTLQFDPPIFERPTPERAAQIAQHFGPADSILVDFAATLYEEQSQLVYSAVNAARLRALAARLRHDEVAGAPIHDGCATADAGVEAAVATLRDQLTHAEAQVAVWQKVVEEQRRNYQLSVARSADIITDLASRLEVAHAEAIGDIAIALVVADGEALAVDADAASDIMLMLEVICEHMTGAATEVGQ